MLTLGETIELQQVSHALLPYIDLLVVHALQSNLLVAAADAALAGDHNIVGSVGCQELKDSHAKTSQASGDDVAAVWAEVQGGLHAQGGWPDGGLMPVLWCRLLLDAQAVVGVLWLGVGSHVHHHLSNVHTCRRQRHSIAEEPHLARFLPAMRGETSHFILLMMPETSVLCPHLKYTGGCATESRVSYEATYG